MLIMVNNDQYTFMIIIDYIYIYIYIVDVYISRWWFQPTPLKKYDFLRWDEMTFPTEWNDHPNLLANHRPALVTSSENGDTI